MAAIASYLPESQIITLSKDFPALENPDDLAGFSTPEQLGFFFHEWIHLLHNTSTISGLALFSTQIILWSNFRWAMGINGLSGGSELMEKKAISDNKNFLKYSESCRVKNENKLPKNIKAHQLILNEVELDPMETENDQVIKSSLIKWEIEFSNALYEVNIGVLEILESAAFMLECELVTKMNGNLLGAPFYPYHLVKTLAGKIAPSLDDRNIICCMIASLQSNDPPRVLLELLKQIEKIDNSMKNIALVDLAKDQINEQESTISNTVKQVRAIFPVDEPMGEFVLMTLNRIERNLRFRIENPFFELTLIDQIAKDSKSINTSIRELGACSIIQERYGDEDQIQRDIIYDFDVPDFSPTASFGLKMARAGIHFISIHYNQSGIIDSTSNQECKCPFYTTCDSSVRKDHSEICSKTPWEARNIENNIGCYYAAAIKAINPPT